MPHHLPSALLLLAVVATAAGAVDRPAGVLGDGRTDDTAALQKALDAAGTAGGEVFLPPGQYLLAGTLNVPTGVCLQGSWDMPHHGAYGKGSTLLLTAGRGDETAPPAIRLNESSALRGFTLLWPEQKWDAIVPYPWAIHGEGMHNTVENVTFVNAYQGISLGAPGWSELHLIRNVFGCVLRRGVQVDGCSDIGRIENVHFNPHYWQRSGHPSIPQDGQDHTMATAAYMWDHLEAFIFGRTDWQYCTNTFVFAAKVGYHFIATKSGACNGQFLGIGADAARTCVLVEGMQPIGLQITNGEFTSFAGEPNTGVLLGPEVQGSVALTNCNFWANKGHVAWLQGPASLTLSDCHFVDKPGPAGAILAEAGKLIVRSCTFDKAGRAIVVGPRVQAAIITGNLQPGGLQVQNGIGTKAQIALNEAGE
ncbi:MAG: glycosyl hydrolase family 28-related protein [Armatimonadota bacterium]